MKYISLSILLTLTVIAGDAKGQVDRDFHRLVYDSVAYVGDTVLGIVEWWSMDASCHCEQFGWIESLPDSNHAYCTDFPYFRIYLAPKTPGRFHDSVIIHTGPIALPNCNCYHDVRDTIRFGAIALSNEVTRIKSKQWSVRMKQDSVDMQFHSSISISVDNNMPDTTAFSKFTAKGSNNTSLSISVTDASGNVDHYVEAPRVRDHALKVAFSSAKYNLCDTIIFSIEIRRTNLDSILTYRVPVTWEAPAAVRMESDGILFSPHVVEGGFVLSFTLDRPQSLSLNLYDGLGREVFASSKPLASNRHDLTIPSVGLPSGVYYYVLRGEGWSRSGKVVKF